MSVNKNYNNSHYYYCYYSFPLHSPFFLFITLLVVLLSRFVVTLSSIGCFKCVSINGNNPSCDDPFHNNYTTEIYESPCMGGRKGRNGLFPATACIKLTGTYGMQKNLSLIVPVPCSSTKKGGQPDDTSDRIMVRSCALDSGTLTTDTELIRMSHCGGFYFDDRYVRGCVQSCDDADGCNSGRRISDSSYLLIIVSILIVFWRQLSYTSPLLSTITAT